MSRIHAHTIREQIGMVEKVFVMGHVMEDFDSIGSAIGVAKMALSLGKETYIVISGQTDSLDKIKEMLRREEIKLIQEDEQYMEIMVTEQEALPLITPGSLLFLVDHHRKILCDSKAVFDHIPKRIIIDHHRRAEYADRKIVV